MASISAIDDFQQYAGFIVKVTMKDGSEPRIGWLSEPRRYIPMGGTSDGKYANATLYLTDNWETFNPEDYSDSEEVLLSADEVESIEVLNRPTSGDS